MDCEWSTTCIKRAREARSSNMKSTFKITLSLLAAASFVLAQDTAPVASDQPQGVQAPTPPDQGGWKRVGDSSSNLGSAPAPDPQQFPQQAPPPVGPPPQLMLQSGTFITVRINQALSSDRNHEGDAFTATLVRPIVIDGFVVAQPGQVIAGRVAEAKKAGEVKGVSHLAVQLTELTLVDGQQLPVQSSLVTRNGPTSQGRDATAIGVTTAVGAGIGAAAAGGVGAAIGAGAGAVASTIGVLLTRGHPTYITPESVLTFQINTPVTIATDRAPQAFRPVGPNDYNSQPQLQAGRPGGPGGYAPPPGAGYGYAGGYPNAAGYPYAYGYPYYGGYPYGYPYAYGFGYPYFGVGFYGGGFYGARFGGGFRGGRR
jgi:hypothetical protein